MEINKKDIYNLGSRSLLPHSWNNYIDVILLAKYLPCEVEGCDYMGSVVTGLNSFLCG